MGAAEHSIVTAGNLGHNHLQVLLFRVGGRQLYGINIFKVREIVPLPDVTLLPGQHANVRGVAHLRGQSTPVFDLSVSMGKRPLQPDAETKLVVTEFNGSTQAFMVSAVDKILNLDWKTVKRPPHGSGKANYLTAVADLDGTIIEIIDVERILAQVQPPKTSISETNLDPTIMAYSQGLEILMVDDSATAIVHTKRALQPFGLTVHTATDGEEALQKLASFTQGGTPAEQKLLCVITDAEMPIMDGYTLTREIRKTELLSGLYVIVHSSIDGRFNSDLVKTSGCDTYLTKFDPEALARLIEQRVSDALAS